MVKWRVRLCAMIMIPSLYCIDARAAIFYVYNKTRKTIYVRPVWNGRNTLHDRIDPGQHVRYNSMLWNVSAIHWLEEVARAEDGVLTLKPFEVSISLGRLNLGGEFTILSDGSFDYYFGVDGTGDGIAPVANGL